MTPERLNTLLTQHAEARQFARELGLEASGSAPAPVVRRRSWAPLAVAAVLALVGGALVVSLTLPRSTPVRTPSLAQSPTPPSSEAPTDGAAVDADPASGEMLVALYQRTDSATAQCPDCWCVRRWNPDLPDGKSLDAVASDALIADSLIRSCTPAPRRMVVVALRGPAASMPASDEQAKAMALCVLDRHNGDSPPAGDAMLAAAMPKPQACVPGGVHVRVALWGK